jgi:hypothetical protein
MFRSWITSLVLTAALFAGFAGVANCQTGPINPPPSGPVAPSTTHPVNADQLYDALRALDPRLTRRDWGSHDDPATLFRIQVKVNGELRRVLVEYDKKEITIKAPLCMPFPVQHELPADVVKGFDEMNRQIAPCKIEKIKVGYSGEVSEMVLTTNMKGPTSLTDFQNRLNQLLDSFAKTKPVWEKLPQK